MSPSAEPVPAVALLDVSESVIEQLLELALRDADADEVTPPLGTTPRWNTERISWFREFHRTAAAGLDGPVRQKSWAISCDGQLAGSIRLMRTRAEPQTVEPTGAERTRGAGGVGGGWVRPGGTFETGIWLGRSFRARGVGREALRLVKSLAASAGADVLVAETTGGNLAALALLKSAGAELVTGDASETTAAPVKARIPLY